LFNDLQFLLISIKISQFKEVLNVLCIMFLGTVLLLEIRGCKLFHFSHVQIFLGEGYLIGSNLIYKMIWIGLRIFDGKNSGQPFVIIYGFGVIKTFMMRVLFDLCNLSSL
jgi:hypothetical protein